MASPSPEAPGPVRHARLKPRPQELSGAQLHRVVRSALLDTAGRAQGSSSAGAARCRWCEGLSVRRRLDARDARGAPSRQPTEIRDPAPRARPPRDANAEVCHGLSEELEVGSGASPAGSPRRRRRRPLARADPDLPRLSARPRRPLGGRPVREEGVRYDLVRPGPGRADAPAHPPADLVGGAGQHPRPGHRDGAPALLRAARRLRDRLLRALHLARPLLRLEPRRGDPPGRGPRRQPDERRDVPAVRRPHHAGGRRAHAHARGGDRGGHLRGPRARPARAHDREPRAPAGARLCARRGGDEGDCARTSTRWPSRARTTTIPSGSAAPISRWP